jgi:tetratricopeptide (TPR) repeat protein
MLAYHWSSALELTRAAGADDADLTWRARLALREAGDRAFALNAHAVAAAQYEDALALWPAEDAERPGLLFRHARALDVAGDERRFDALEAATAELLAYGDRSTAAEAQAFASTAEWYRGDRRAAQEHMERALELVEVTEPSLGKARVLAFSARLQMLAGDGSEAIRVANEALAIAEQLQLDEIRAHALATRGSSHDDPAAGIPDVEEALRVALDSGSPIAGAIANNLAVLLTRRGELGRATEIYEEAVELARRIGDVDVYRFTRGNVAYQLFFRGRWDDAVALADAFVAECATSPHYMEGAVRGIRAYIRTARGDVKGAFEDEGRALELGREIGDPQRLLPSLFGSARTHALVGDPQAAVALAREGIAVLRDHPDYAGMVGHLALVADELGVRDEILDVLQRASDVSFWVEAARASALGDHERARDMFREAGAHTFAAECSLLAGAALLRAGDLERARSSLEEALEFYRSVGATYFVLRIETLVADAYSESA